MFVDFLIHILDISSLHRLQRKYDPLLTSINKHSLLCSKSPLKITHMVRSLLSFATTSQFRRSLKGLGSQACAEAFRRVDAFDIPTSHLDFPITDCKILYNYTLNSCRLLNRYESKAISHCSLVPLGFSTNTLTRRGSWESKDLVSRASN